MHRFRDPGLQTFLTGVGIVVAVIIALIVGGGTLYSGHLRWALASWSGAAFLSVLTLAYWLWLWLDVRRTALTPSVATEQVAGEDRIAILELTLEEERKALAEAKKKAQPVDELRKERDTLAAELIDANKKIITQELLTIKAENEVRLRDVRLDDLKEKINWIDDLIDAARGRRPFYFQPDDCRLTNLEYLDKPEPWFDLCVRLNYTGIHHVIVGEKITGFLARFNGDKFNHEPIPIFDLDEKPPFSAEGPTWKQLCLRQRVSRESAAELKEVLAKYAHPETKQGGINFRTQDLYISIRVLTKFGEELYSGRLFGEDQEVRYTWRE